MISGEGHETDSVKVVSSTDGTILCLSISEKITIKITVVIQLTRKGLNADPN